MKRGWMVGVLAVTLCAAVSAEEHGSIQINAPVGFEVYLDDVYYGVTSEEEGGIVLERVPAGAHKLVLTDEEYTDDREIYVQPNKTLVLEIDAATPEYEVERLEGQTVTVEKATGTFVMRSLPVGAKVYVDDRYIDRSDFVLRNFATGEHTITMQREDETLSRSVTLTEDDEVTMLFNFRSGRVELTSKREELYRRYRENRQIVLESRFQIHDYRSSERDRDSVTSPFYMPDGSEDTLRVRVDYENKYREHPQRGKTYVVHDVNVAFRFYLGDTLVARGGYNPEIYRRVLTNPGRYNPGNVGFTDRQGLLDGTYRSENGLFEFQVFWSKARGSNELVTRFEVQKRFRVEP